jgi:hypothetical protein
MKHEAEVAAEMQAREEAIPGAVRREAELAAAWVRREGEIMTEVRGKEVGGELERKFGGGQENKSAARRGEELTRSARLTGNGTTLTLHTFFSHSHLPLTCASRRNTHPL